MTAAATATQSAAVARRQSGRWLATAGQPAAVGTRRTAKAARGLGRAKTMTQTSMTGPLEAAAAAGTTGQMRHQPLLLLLLL